MPAPAMPAATPTPVETVERFLAATTSADPGDLADCYAEQVVIEMPFAPAALYPSRIETGREELRTRFRAGTALRTYQRVDRVRIHRTADPAVVITEYDLHGRMAADGEAFTLSFLMVITVREGRIVHTRDYTDPIAGAQALGRLPALLAALTEGAAEETAQDTAETAGHSPAERSGQEDASRG